ncbi:MAG: DUF4403 family protein [Candidatus Hydrogenedentes bacterium]|nr:DUF4403 family protein [Candidatus Hydrogenedentota bacterium]
MKTLKIRRNFVTTFVAMAFIILSTGAHPEDIRLTPEAPKPAEKLSSYKIEAPDSKINVLFGVNKEEILKELNEMARQAERDFPAIVGNPPGVNKEISLRFSPFTTHIENGSTLVFTTTANARILTVLFVYLFGDCKLDCKAQGEIKLAITPYLTPDCKVDINIEPSLNLTKAGCKACGISLDLDSPVEKVLQLLLSNASYRLREKLVDKANQGMDNFLNKYTQKEFKPVTLLEIGNAKISLLVSNSFKKLYYAGLKEDDKYIYVQLGAETIIATEIGKDNYKAETPKTGDKPTPSCSVASIQEISSLEIPLFIDLIDLSEEANKILKQIPVTCPLSNGANITIDSISAYGSENNNLIFKLGVKGSLPTGPTTASGDVYLKGKVDWDNATKELKIENIALDLKSIISISKQADWMLADEAKAFQIPDIVYRKPIIHLEELKERVNENLSKGTPLNDYLILTGKITNLEIKGIRVLEDAILLLISSQVEDLSITLEQIEIKK